MHLIVNRTEFKKMKGTFKTAPNGTTICVQDGRTGHTEKLYELKDGVPELMRDYKEENREWSKGEREEFEDTITTRDQVFDFFLNGDELDERPYREYSSYCEKETELLTYIKHDGCYTTYTDSNKEERQLNRFDIMVPRKSLLPSVKEEIMWAVEKIRKAHPDLKGKVEFGIFEHTLSEYGCYSLAIKADGKCQLEVTRYGSHSVEEKFDTIMKALKYIRKNHYYDSWDERDYEDALEEEDEHGENLFW